MLDAEVAIFQWDEGRRRLRDAPPSLRPTLERVVERIVDELRRRVGGPFTAVELVALYGAGIDWCQDVALRTAPDVPDAWDLSIVADAAFARYLREARDYAGGRPRRG